MSVLTDDFTRADGPLGNATTGEPWTVLRGTVVIAGNTADIAQESQSFAVLDAGAGGQNALIGAYWESYQDQAIYFRVSDVNNWWRFGVVATSGGVNGGLALEKCVAGTVVRVWSGGATFFVMEEMRVWAVGNRIRVYQNRPDDTLPLVGTGNQRADITDSFNATATKHGVGAMGRAFSGSDCKIDSFFINAPNDPPNAPALTFPVGGVVVPTTTTLRLSWVFSDPNPGDSQSASSVRYRAVGDTLWTTLSSASPNAYRDLAAGTLTDDDWEWQAQTSDSVGEPSPWSASGFFTAATPPDGPTITAPTAGATIGTPTVELAWSTASQEAYQVRSVADDAGSPDTGTVLYESGTVTSVGLRAHIVPLPVNGRTEHLQVSTQDDGLWSPWSSVLITASYTDPAMPGVTVTPDDELAVIVVSIDNPVPTGTEPAVVRHEVWRRLSSETTGIRLAASVTPGEDFTDRTPAHLVDYAYRVVSVGTTGATATSEWVGAASPAPEPEPGVIDGGTPADDGSGDDLDGGTP